MEPRKAAPGTVTIRTPMIRNGRSTYIEGTYKMDPRKQAIMVALDKFVAQRPGLEFGNYGDVKAYRSEMRSITRDRHDYSTLARAVERSDSITADMLVKAAESAFSGRLTIRECEWHQFTPDECPGKPCGSCCDHRQFKGFAISYTAGQYFPTEYRKAACAVLASALWEQLRNNLPPIMGYRVESWSQLGKGRTRHERHTARSAAQAESETVGGRDYGSVNEVYSADNLSVGEWMRGHFRREFGRSIANRWFS